MGDRGNIVILMNAEAAPVYLYSHWGGTELPEVLASALAKRWRWDDPPYLARIIFDEMTASVHGYETGYGIATFPCDNEHDYLVVDTLKQEVRVLAYRVLGSDDEHRDPLKNEVKGRFDFMDVVNYPERLTEVFE